MLTPLLEVYNYNKARNVKDHSIFEVGRGYSSINGEYIEENKLACLMSGNYTLGLQKESYDFYVVKGIVEDLLDNLGYAGRYSFVVKELPEEMHPTKSVYINVNGKIVGLMGQVHPKICKEEVYVIEINLDRLFENKTGRLKNKEFSKFPGISKDVAFVLPKNVNSAAVIDSIKRGGGKLLKSVEVFDYYEGDKIEENKKSIAYNLYFESFEKTLSDEEVTNAFNKVIKEVTNKALNVAKQNGRIIHTKINILDFNFRQVDEISGVVLEGSTYNIDATSDIRRTCNISLVPIDRTFNVEYGGKLWMDKYIQVFIGIEDVTHNNEIVYISALKNEGLSNLENKITEVVFGEKGTIQDATYISNARQVAKLNDALNALNEAIAKCYEQEYVDIIDIHIREAYLALGEIIGDGSIDSLIDELFSKFCLGK